MKAARIFAVFALATAACFPPPREVRRTPTGGELALAMNNDSTREEATKLMNARCPSGFDILEEGEVVVGQVTNTNVNQRQNVVNVFGPSTSSNATTTTEDKREWRIVYQCRGVGVPTAERHEVRYTTF